MLTTFALIASVVVATWNGNWFPSGRAEHRAHPDVEDATTTASARMLADGLRRIDPTGTNDVILCLNEMRGPKAASNLIERIGRKGLRLASISGYRRRDRFDQQQDVIATTLPVADASWSRWKDAKAATPPRGYAFASVVIDPATTALVYAVHLKSNYGATTDDIRALNRDKRTAAISQILDAVRKRRGQSPRPVLLLGDFNADRWNSRYFGEERIFDLLDGAGFTTPLALLDKEARATYPSRRFGDGTLDYIYCRGFAPNGKPVVLPNDGLSDHHAVFALIGVSP